MNEIREWRKQGLTASDFRYADKSVVIDDLLAALGEKEERLAIKDDALCAATMVGEFAISKLKVATEALERIESGDFINSAFSPAKVIAAAALKEIGGVRDE